MHVLGIPVDPNWLIQFIITAFIVAVGLLHLVRNTASRYFVVDADLDEPSDVVLSHSSSSNLTTMSYFIDSDSPTDACAVCGKSTKKQCSSCKLVKYCSESCQRSHWNSGHKIKCKDLTANLLHSAPGLRRRRTSNVVPLVPDRGIPNIFNQSKKILFPYEDFVELFNWNKPGFPPCGLLNCGNSCFANVVLQCLTYTRPLIAYLLDRGHRRECRQNDWCFLCEFQTHVERYSESLHPFSPINILSRLPNIGGNLGYGRQEDAHEFMRFAIDTMQSVCLDEFGGEKAIPPSSQETTLIQHIFGGHLQSQVICTKCNNISSQFENMMDLTVEIHGDAASVEECLDQFTAREWLQGDNMYKCDGCNEYVIAWKRLSIRRAPNILTIALKRFQSGRFGKLNKRVTFPETLDLCPYTSQQGDGNDVYRLYGVVVHLDMLNASFFGHYICYIKDFCGNWYMVDDCKVHRVELDEVLSQGAYMLLYTRVCVHPSSLYPDEQSKKEPEMIKVDTDVESCPRQSVEQFSGAESIGTASSSGTQPSYNGPLAKVSDAEEELSSTNSIDLTEDGDKVDLEASSSVFMDVEDLGKADAEISHVEDISNMDSGAFSGPFSSISNFENENGVNSGLAEEGRLIDSPVKDRVTADFYVCEKGGKPQNISVAALGSGEISVGTVSVHCKGKLEKVETRNVMLASCSIKDAEGRLNGRDPKPKPLFTLGFLGKQKQDKVSIWEGKSTAELQELASYRDLNSEGNHGFSKPDVCLKSDGEKKHNGKSHFEGNISSNIVLKKQTEASVNEDVMVTNKSVESVSLSNVDCFIPNDAGERSSSVSMNEKKLVVVERNPVCAEFHGMAGTTLEKTGPNVKQEA